MCVYQLIERGGGDVGPGMDPDPDPRIHASD
jgi:hypothetical protein